MPGHTRKGFTLIELLIVVAIIAILAAIAVPNFLEAHVRAKASRARADMRTIAVAIESYTVDYNRPPIGFWEGNLSDPALLGYPSVFEMERAIMASLTTPVAYISNVLMDPFADRGFHDQGGGYRAPRWAYYKYDTSFEKGLGPNGQVPAQAFIRAQRLGVTWVLQSRGPAGREFTRAETMEAVSQVQTSNIWYPNLLYDPTNGTVSIGFIYRSNRSSN